MLFTHLDELKVDLFKIYLANCIDKKIVALRVVEAALGEGFMGGPSKTTINLRALIERVFVRYNMVQ